MNCIDDGCNFHEVWPGTGYEVDFHFTSYWPLAVGYWRITVISLLICFWSTIKSSWIILNCSSFMYPISLAIISCVSTSNADPIDISKNLVKSFSDLRDEPFYPVK